MLAYLRQDHLLHLTASHHVDILSVPMYCLQCDLRELAAASIADLFTLP
jgi:hypothetical protein